MTVIPLGERIRLATPAMWGQEVAKALERELFPAFFVSVNFNAEEKPVSIKQSHVEISHAGVVSGWAEVAEDIQYTGTKLKRVALVEEYTSSATQDVVNAAAQLRAGGHNFPRSDNLTSRGRLVVAAALLLAQIKDLDGEA